MSQITKVWIMNSFFFAARNCFNCEINSRDCLSTDLFYEHTVIQLFTYLAHYLNHILVIYRSRRVSSIQRTHFHSNYHWVQVDIIYIFEFILFIF